MRAKKFKFPGDKNKNRKFDFISNGKHLGFSLIEVGCKTSKKRAALRDKKELIYMYWAQKYRSADIVDWNPQIFKIIAHYDPDGLEKKAYNKKVKADHAIFCKYIPQSILEELNDIDYKHIFHTVTSLSKKRDLLEDIIIYNKDANKLHKLIVDHGQEAEYSILRGKMAEILIQKTVEKSRPKNMTVHRNGYIKYLTNKFEKYNEGTEIDAIATFYGSKPYIQLVDNLKKIDYLVIKEDDFWKKK